MAQDVNSRFDVCPPSRPTHHHLNDLLRQRFSRFARFRADPWMEQVGNATLLDIEIRESATKHSVTLKQVESWLASVSTSPHVASKKTRLKMMLMRG